MDEGDGAALMGLGGDVTYDEAVGATAEAAIGDEGDAFAQAGADEGGGGFEHFGHTGCADGADVPDDYYVAGLYLAGVDAIDEFVFAVEDTGCAFEAFAFLAADLSYAAAFGQIAVKDLEVAGGFDRVFQGLDDILFCKVETWDILQVFGECLAGDGEAVAVQQSFFEQVFHDGGYTAIFVKVLHEEFAAGLKVSQYGDAVADGREIVLGERDVYAAGHGDKVQDGIGAAAEDHDGRDRILEGFPGHDVAGLDIFFEQVEDGCSCVEAFFLFVFAEGRIGGREGEAHAQGFDGGGHGVSGIHTTAGACAGAGIADDTLEVCFVELTGDLLSQGFEGRDDVEVLSFIAARGDGAAVDHDRGSIEPAHGDEAAGHVLVTAGQGDESVVVLGATDGFYGVGDDIAANQGVAHAVGAVGHAVADADGIEDKADKFFIPDAFFDDLREVVEVHVTGVAVVAHAGDAHLCFCEVFVCQSNAIQHRLCGGLCRILSECLAVLI